MTKQEIIDLRSQQAIAELQIQLNKQGFNLKVDGVYGKKTRDAYAEYLDRDPQVPTLVPPAPIPWWQNKTALSILATILVAVGSLFGLDLDTQNLSEILTLAATLVTSVLALLANARSVAPVDRTLVAPGLRLKTSGGVPAKSQSDSGSTPGPFGY